MWTTFLETLRSRTAADGMLQLPRLGTLAHSRDRALQLAALTAIVALAAWLRFANLAALGYANHYYAAAVKSMLQSWHNFFFVAAEPGGSVTVDKPPVGLWLQTVSAYFLGVNGFALLLPQIVAGIASVIVVYHLVRRWFGAPAGLLAALALAITPVVVATDRNNTIDSTLILTLLLAAWAFIKATESPKLRYLLLGAALVGIGFNIKMLEAYLPLPAFYALYFLGSAERLGRKLLNLGLATALLLAISLSWAVAVDLTPADQRPYVGSSGNNSELSLIVGYNGLERLLGMGFSRSGNLGSLLTRGSWSAGARDGAQMRPLNPGANGGFRQPGADGASQWPHRDGNGTFPPGGANGAPPQVGRGFAGGSFGMGGTGRAGVLRLFTPPLSKEASWLLPFGLFSALLLVFRARLRWPLAPKHRALVLWGGWLLTGVVFFSIAGFFHEYYLSMIAAPLAALVGIGAVELWRLHGKHPWLASALLVTAAAGTLVLQIITARAFVGPAWWLWIAVALLALGAAISIATAALRRLRPGAIAGFACVVVALLFVPGVWSGLTMLNSSANQSLPAAYSGRPSRPENGGGLQVNQALLDYLEPRTQDTEFLMAVPSSMQGADYVLATGRPVLYMGGFMGQDQVLTADQLARLVSEGKLRYVLWDGRTGNRGPFGLSDDQSELSQWIMAHGKLIQGFETATQNSGAPDGTRATPPDEANSVLRDGTRTGNGWQAWGRGEMQVSLYELGS